MTKKKKDKPLNKRFNSDDVKQWQQCANKLYKGNLTFWIEETLNANAYDNVPKNVSIKKILTKK